MTRLVLAAVVVVVVVVAGAGACATTGPHQVVMTIDAPPEDADREPFVLREPHEFPENFVVQQSIAIHGQQAGRPVEGQLDAVLQKQGDSLTIVGLGPMNARAFSLVQRGKRIEFEQLHGPELPFSPRRILVDVQRVFFCKGLPPPAGAGYSGVMRGLLDGESVEERWERGELRQRRFGPDGAVRVDYGPGCRADRCHPETATVRNERVDYTLTITSHDYEALD